MSTEITDEMVKEFFTSIFNEGYNSFITANWDKFKASKQPKPDWEIISYRFKAFVPREGGNVIVDKDSLHWVPAQEDRDNYEIFSVKRLSDQQIFTINDKVWPALTIKSFYFPKEYEARYGECDLAVCFEEPNANYCFQDLKQREIAFTTEDAVKLFEGDNMALVSTNNWIISFPVRACKTPFKGDKDQFKYFSTKEAAETYIQWNKPLFSLEEISKHGGGLDDANPYFRTLIQKAKEKLNTTTQ